MYMLLHFGGPIWYAELLWAEPWVFNGNCIRSEYPGSKHLSTHFRTHECSYCSSMGISPQRGFNFPSNFSESQSILVTCGPELFSLHDLAPSADKSFYAICKSKDLFTGRPQIYSRQSSVREPTFVLRGPSSHANLPAFFRR